jgi:hypothetical protein
MIARHLAQLQSDNSTQRGRPKASESNTEHKLVQFYLQRQAEKKPVTVQDAIEFMRDSSAGCSRRDLPVPCSMSLMAFDRSR